MHQHYATTSTMSASELIEYLYSEALPKRAAKVAHKCYELRGVRLDVEDVLQAGIEYALRRIEHALQTDHPVASLIHGCSFAMLHYCQEQSCSIYIPYWVQCRGTHAPSVSSLDAPLYRDTDLTLADILPA